MKRLGLTTAIFMGVTACTDQTPVAPDDAAREVRFEIISGSNQTAPVGAQLPAPLVVRVVDGSGAPVVGQTVNFVVTSGGGSVYAGASTSNAQGLVQDWWTLGTREGTQTLEVRSVDNTTGEKKLHGTFTAVAVVTSPGVPGRLAFATAPLTSTTFSATASWDPTNANGYEWTVGPATGEWSATGSGPGSQWYVTMHMPRQYSLYNFCVRSIGAGGARSAWTCGQFDRPPAS